MKSLGQRIRELRDEKDLSTRELANKAPISVAFLSDIELGRRHPSDKILRMIAKALDTPFEELQQYDTRPTVEEFKRRLLTDPKLNFAYRRLLDENFSAEELVKLADEKAKRKKK
jgi:transcriptional regulator with XRE-family HTH domain